MPITFANQPVIDLIRDLVDQELLDDGDTPVVIPDDYAEALYSFNVADCPLTVIRVYEQMDKPRWPAVLDIAHSIKLCIYHVRARTAEDIVTEDVAAQRINSFAVYFAQNTRLGGNVQQCDVTNRATGNQAAMGANFIPEEQLEGLAVACLELTVWWVESLATS
jgi:hypothetical protein